MNIQMRENIMGEKMREIEKMQINLVDNENNVRIFVLRRMNEDTGILCVRV